MPPSAKRGRESDDLREGDQPPAVRRRAVELLATGLRTPGAGGEAAAPVAAAAAAAAAIELSLHGLTRGRAAEYRGRARMLRSNLAHPENGPLRARVLSGALGPAELCG
ncbi:unnamed protein product, partial [Prorocentrum cordatum]